MRASAQRQAAGVERRRPELRPELLDRRLEIPCEDVLDHPDLAIVVEREVDVLVADEVDRRPGARRAVHGDPDPAVAGRQEEERGRENWPRPLLWVTEE